MKHDWAGSCSYHFLPEAEIPSLHQRAPITTTTAATASLTGPSAPQPLSGLGLHSKTRTTALPLNPQRPNYSDCWRNHKNMQSYFALIEDVFNTLQGLLRPHYESDETAKPLQREFKTYICVWQRRRALWSGGLDALTGGGGGVNSEMSHLWNNTHKTNRSLTNVKTFWFVGKQQHFNAVDIRGAASFPGSRARLNKATC